MARARHDLARGITDGLAVAERQPRLVACAERHHDRNADDVRVSTAVDNTGRISIELELRVAERIGERRAERVGIGQPALFTDGFRVAKRDRDSESDSERVRLTRAGQG